MTARITTLSLLLAASFGRLSAQATFSSDKPRPLMEVLRQMEDRYGWRISYEDPPYENLADLINVIGPVYASSHPGATFLIPRPQPFSVTVPAGVPSYNAAAGETAGLASIESAIAAVVAQAPENGPNGFGVSFDGAFSHVAATQYRKKDGTVVPFAPMLSTVVAFPPAERTIRDAVNLVCTQVAVARGIAPLAEGTIPTNLYHQIELTYADHEPASVVLTRIFADNDVTRASLGYAPLRITWDLLYDANAKSYFFSTHPIMQFSK